MAKKKRNTVPKTPSPENGNPEGISLGFRIETSILLECIDDAREQLLLACEGVGADDRGNEVDFVELRHELISALGSLVTAKREAEGITRQAAAEWTKHQAAPRASNGHASNGHTANGAS